MVGFVKAAPVAAMALVGAALLFAHPAAAADSVLVNGGFEAATLSPWTTSGGIVAQAIGSGVAGSRVAVIGFDSSFTSISGVLSQSFTTSQAGVVDYAFDAGRAEAFGPFNDVALTFVASLDGDVLSSALPTFDPGGGGAPVATRLLSHYFGSVQLDAGAHQLSFAFSRGDTLFGRGPFFVLDGVEASLTPAAGPGPGVPEPATWTMMIMGFGAAGAMLRRRRLAPA